MDYDVILLGGGQAVLATAYFLRRTSLSFVILDAEAAPGGAWQHAWTSLHLFSPASWSSLPGWPMSPTGNVYPTRDQVIDYVTRYESHYQLPVECPVEIKRVTRQAEGFELRSADLRWRSRAVISTTGTWSQPWGAVLSGTGALRRPATALGALPRCEPVCGPSGRGWQSGASYPAQSSAPLDRHHIDLLARGGRRAARQHHPGSRFGLLIQRPPVTPSPFDRFGRPDSAFQAAVESHGLDNPVLRIGMDLPTRGEIAILSATELYPIVVDSMWESPSELIPDNTQISELRAAVHVHWDP